MPPISALDLVAGLPYPSSLIVRVMLSLKLHPALRLRPITEFQMFKPSSEFARASDDAKSALIATSTRRAYVNNEVIYLQEEGAQNLYFVVSGHCCTIHAFHLNRRLGVMYRRLRQKNP
jgi:hypothetical protein